MGDCDQSVRVSKRHQGLRLRAGQDRRWTLRRGGTHGWDRRSAVRASATILTAAEWRRVVEETLDEGVGVDHVAGREGVRSNLFHRRPRLLLEDANVAATWTG